MLNQITPLLLTYNEAPNLDRTLQCLTWATLVVVVDSFSTDETLDILHRYPQVKVFQRSFDTHAHQWNYGLQQVQTEWVLSLDADYQVTDELVAEMDKLPIDSTIDAYSAHFKYCVLGQPLRATLLPPREILFRRDRATYFDDGHTQRLQVHGTTDKLSACIYHDDRKSLSRWLWAQDRYMVIEAQKLVETPTSELSWGDRIRQQKVLAPFAILFYCLILKAGILDGWAGWYYALQRMLAETLLAIRLIELERVSDRHRE